MIESLTIVDPAAVPVRAFNKSPNLSSGKTFHFKPGLNIVWGRNGAGKSMLLRLIASVFHCEQSGEPVYTHHSLNDLGLHKSEAEQSAIARSFQMVHDGQTVYALDPEKAVGIAGGSFDDDFFGMGIRNTLFRGSSGHARTSRRARGVRGGVSMAKTKLGTLRVCFKDPDALTDQIREHVEASLSDLGLDRDEAEAVIDRRVEKIDDLVSKFFEHGEYLMVEIDLDAEGGPTARVVSK